MQKRSAMRDKLGICQWFHYQDHEAVERAATLLEDLGVRHLRTGISWADFHRPEGREWYDWMLRTLSGVEILLSVWHTPPSIAEGGTCAGPPRRLADYADFIWEVNDLWGDRYADLELWNEPNNRLKWDFRRFDPDWSKFARMIDLAAAQAKRDGKRTVLGGMIPVDHHWLRLIDGHGGLDCIDVVAIHGFPGMWWDDHPNWDWYRHWHGWDRKIEGIAEHAGGRPIWVTETGLATCEVADGTPARFDLQVEWLEAAAAAPTERVYWYCLEDLDPERPAIEGFHVDENEYHLGLVSWEGERKPASDAFRELLAGERVPEPVLAGEAFGSGHFPSPESSGGRVLAEVAEERGVSPRAVALAFLVREPGLFTIPRSFDPAHVESNAAAARMELSDEEVERIDRAFPRGARRHGVPTL